MVVSQLLLARMSPSGEKATQAIPSVWPCSVAISCRALTSQSLTASQSALARVAPSGENATDSTENVCPCRAATSCRVWTSQSLTVPSEIPAASVSPLGESATDQTLAPGSKKAVRWSVLVSHSSTPILVATARISPFGEYVTASGRPNPRRSKAPSGSAWATLTVRSAAAIRPMTQRVWERCTAFDRRDKATMEVLP